MKNLFKSLVLVAVAAMAFTACQKDVNEVNVIKENVVLTFTAGFDDTRANFGEFDGEVYPIEFAEDDAARLTVDLYDGSSYGTGYNVAVEEANFELLSKSAITFSVVAPADWKYDEDIEYVYARYGATGQTFTNGSSAEYQAYADISGVQKPTATSVDPNFIAMVAEFPVSYNDAVGQYEYAVEGTFKHLAAYAKMTLPVVDGVKFETVKVTMSYRAHNDWGSSWDEKKSYTLNVADLAEQTYWFACYPMEVEKFSVEAETAEGVVYEYETEAEAAAEGETAALLSLKAGVATSFTVKELVEYVAPEPANYVFTTASAYGSAWESWGDMYLTFVAEDGTTLELNAYRFTEPEHNYVPDGTYGFGYGEGVFYLGSNSLKTPDMSYGEQVYDGEVTFAEVDGQYVVTFTDLYWVDWERSEYVYFSGSFVGQIEGLVVPSQYGVEPEPEPEPAKLYFTPGVWNVDGAWYAAYFFGDGDAWETMTLVEGETDVYELVVPEGGYTHVIFVRLDPAYTTPNWDGKWNQTGNLVLPADENTYYTVTGWGDFDGSWGVYTPSTQGGDVEESPYTFVSAALGSYFGSYADFNLDFATASGNIVVSMNLYNTGYSDKNYIKEGTYNIAPDSLNPCVYTGGYSWVVVNGAQYSIADYFGTLTVSEVDGKYRFEIAGAAYFDADNNIVLFDGSYEGNVEGLVVPSAYVPEGGEGGEGGEVVGFAPVRAEYDDRFEDCADNDSEYAIWLYNEAGDCIEVLCHCDRSTDYSLVWTTKLTYADGTEVAGTVSNTQAPNNWNCDAGQKFIKVTAEYEDGTTIDFSGQIAATYRNEF